MGCGLLYGMCVQCYICALVLDMCFRLVYGLLYVMWTFVWYVGCCIVSGLKYGVRNVV